MSTEKKKMPTDPEEIRAIVRKGYGEMADGCGCDCSGCGPEQGYGEQDLSCAPEGANLGLGCGNPTALASLKPGEVVVDLGAGGGLDAFIAARQVAPGGKVIGVDMTPEMLERSRAFAEEAGMSDTVEFREGIIEDLPVDSESADVVISNCVINLSPDKPKVFREAFRVLKPGGRLAISDIVLTAPLPEGLAEEEDTYLACISGALLEKDYMAAVTDAGFVDLGWTRASAGPMEGPVWSYQIEARKP